MAKGTKGTGAAQCIFDLERFVSNVVKIISINVTNEITRSTPVLTGHAKSNWIPSIGGPGAGVVGSPASVNSGAQKAGIASLGAYSLKNGRVFIVNNVSYIGDLNNGSSAKAPSGFVQGGIIRGVTKATGQAAALSAGASR